MQLQKEISPRIIFIFLLIIIFKNYIFKTFDMKNKDKNNWFGLFTKFTYTINVLMKPFSLCLMLAFIVPNLEED